jgi:hypothetical protein
MEYKDVYDERTVAALKNELLRLKGNFNAHYTLYFKKMIKRNLHGNKQNS